MRRLTSRVSLLMLAALLCAASPARAAITFFGAATAPATDGGTNTGPSMSITPPASMTAGMLVIVDVAVKQTGLGWTEVTITNTGGQVWHEINNDSCGATNLSCRLYFARFNGTWSANPVFDGLVATVASAEMMVFAESDSSLHFDIDVMPVFTSSAAAATITAPSITTATSNAVAVAIWMSVDDNTWNGLTAGWAYANPGGANQARNASGTGQSITSAYQVFGAAGATGTVSQTEATLGNDAAITLIMAFKTIAAPSSAAPTVDMLSNFETSTNGTTITAPIMTSSTQGSGCTWTAASAPGAANIIATAAQKSLSSTHALKVSTTTFDDTGATRGVSRDHTADDTDQGTFSCAFSSNKAIISFGYFFSSSYGSGTGSPGSLCGSATVGCDYTSMAMFADGSGAFTAFNINASFSDLLVARLECNSNVPQMPHFSPSHTYWVTFKMDTTAGKCYGAMYDPSNSWNQVGFTVFTTIATGSAANRIQVFMTGGSFEPTATGTTQYDNLAMDFTTAAFPLLPGTAAATTTAPSRMLFGVGGQLYIVTPHR
jgi:hypothetical protein